MNILCLFRHKWECIAVLNNTEVSNEEHKNLTFKMRCARIGCGKIETWVDLCEGKKRRGIYQKVN